MSTSQLKPNIDLIQKFKILMETSTLNMIIQVKFFDRKQVGFYEVFLINNKKKLDIRNRNQG